MSYTLDKDELRRLIKKEIKSIEEDALVVKSDNTLGGNIRPGHTKYHDCPECFASMELCNCGFMEQDECNECGTMIYESSCGCEPSSDYPVPMRKDIDAEVEGIDFKDLLKSIIGIDAVGPANLDSSIPSPGEAVGIGYNIGKQHHSGAYMAKSQMYKVSKYADKLYHMIPDGHNLEDWMRTKLAQISDDISEVYHALEHDIYEGDL